MKETDKTKNTIDESGAAWRIASAYCSTISTDISRLGNEVAQVTGSLEAVIYEIVRLEDMYKGITFSDKPAGKELEFAMRRGIDNLKTQVIGQIDYMTRNAKKLTARINDRGWKPEQK